MVSNNPIDWDKFKAKCQQKYPDGKFCYCGLVAIKCIKGEYYCLKHKIPKGQTKRRGRYPGKSKSPYAYNEY
jgi:hypothetical protein